jgi:hypothetical protein
LRFPQHWIFPLWSGSAIAQAVSPRLPVAAARVRAKFKSCGICGGQSGTGAGFLRVFRFPLPILIPLTPPHSSSYIIRGWYNRPISGRRTKWTQSHHTPRKKKYFMVFCVWHCLFLNGITVVCDEQVFLLASWICKR